MIGNTSKVTFTIGMLLVAIFGCTSPPMELPTYTPTPTPVAPAFVCPEQGLCLQRLTENEAYDDSPSWSPDGDRIVFQSDGDGNFEIYIVSNFPKG